MIELAVPEAYRLWSASYDDGMNPVLALEMRVLHQWLNPLAARRVLDVATGTGRWAAYLKSRGAQVIALDLSPAMLGVAARKPELRGRLLAADMRALPISDGAADLALCSLALGYVESPEEVLRELARVARTVVVSDLHPEAVAAGWERTFRSGGTTYRIRAFAHSVEAIERAAKAVGLVERWELDARFGPPEARFFQDAGRDAGKEDLFTQAQQFPAIFARCWENARL
ncbi:MAG: class I SAM-dependent methyltransferase [Acidobacteriota bacterium]